MRRVKRKLRGESEEEKTKESRWIYYNAGESDGVKSSFMTNRISTAKYNVFTFVPKFLFEQFRRYSNIFFLCIGLLQQVPHVSPTGRYVTIVPLIFILFVTALKEILEDFKRHREDDNLNNTLVKTLNFKTRKWLDKPWKNVVVGDVLYIEDDHFFPADMLLLSSSEPQGMCYIETSNLDGETNLKIRSPTPETSGLNNLDLLCEEFHGVVECEAPNRNLYEFVGNVKKNPYRDFVPVPPSGILLRGTKLKNTPWVIGAVVYTGHESKLLKNSTEAPLKRSTVDKITNSQIIFLFLILLIIAFLSASASYFVNRSNKGLFYLGETVDNNFFLNLLTFVILYNNLIPISLQVTLEMVRFIQAYFINWDKDMYHEESGTPARARTSNLNEELGQIKYLFTDKTGTLTQNVMVFKGLSIAGKKYRVTDTGEGELDSELVRDIKQGGKSSEFIKEILILMAVCHTVIPEKDEETQHIEYHASSPDEKALVMGAALYGFQFIARKPESVLIKTVFGNVEEYTILNVIEFTSARKKMSVLVKCPDGTIKLYVKGADSVIMKTLKQSPDEDKILSVAMAHLEDFAREGLRTLCCATRVISFEEYNSWNILWNKASTSIEEKEEKINNVASLIEKNLTLLGSTAIEDKLQDGVPETIRLLLNAGIHIWVLTGDKLETAINIGYSCKLLKEQTTLIVIDSTNLDDTRRHITSYLEDISNTKSKDVSLVVEGHAIKYALEESICKDFVDLCRLCSSVICCRISPIQKAEIVELVKHNCSAISLAVGDGANDVAMIQKADVGVGISGKEGMQAVNSSDFSIGQFRFLAKLLLVHGAWNYTRISKVILYSFYKNICLYIIELWFAIYNFWSGQVLFERWTIGLYNIFFTSAPPIAMGLFDQYFSSRNRFEYPCLYEETQKSELFNHVVFWKWIINSIIHSIFLFWLPMVMYSAGNVWKDGKTGDYLAIGNIVYSYVVITVCCKAGLEMDSWNFFTHSAIWGSILFWFGFLVIYSYIWPIGIPFAPNMAGMIELILSTNVFWLGVLLIPFIALLPDILVKSLKGTTGKVASIHALVRRNPRSGPLTETSVLLNNVRQPVIQTCFQAELEMSHGYAFSQEESGDISQTEIIRRYNTTQSSVSGT